VGNVAGTSGRLRELKIRSGEVIAQAKQWLACKLGYGVGHAVAEVQSRTVPALAEGNKRVGRDRPVIGRELLYIYVFVIEYCRDIVFGVL
jgi:hypothetical protein